MKRRLVLYFHYDPQGQVDTACQLSVRAMLGQAQVVLFVSNGSLCAAAREWVQHSGAQLLERENTGFDVGAYRAALQSVGRTSLAAYDELVLMNYTLAGPVCPLEPMFETMAARPELDFWGLTRHFAMHSRRFGGRVAEHLQSHFLALRPRLFNSDAFWAYWQDLTLPKTYEQAVAGHEVRFTAHFSALGYHWDSYVAMQDLQDVFVNPIMACPRLLLAERGCPFFKRRSFFTPYADELRRTDGQSARELYDYLKTQTDYPVDALLRAMLPTQPLTVLAQNLHWRYLLHPQPGTVPQRGEGVALQPGRIYCVVQHPQGQGTALYYQNKAATAFLTPEQQAGAAALFAAQPLLGVLSPAMPPLPAAQAALVRLWRQQLPALRDLMVQYGITVPLDETQPPPAPRCGVVLVRGDAFPNGLPPLDTPANWWLLPLLAQQNGYASAVCEPEAQALARAALQNQLLLQTMQPQSAARALGRALKYFLREKFARKGE